MDHETRNPLIKCVGKAIFLSSIQASLGSVEMSSKFSVLNFSKDQETLDNAVAALKNYIFVAVIWTIGTILSLYASFGIMGLIVGLIANAVMMGWIIISYQLAFEEAAIKNKLTVSPVFTTSEWIMMTLLVSIASGFGCYFIPRT